MVSRRSILAAGACALGVPFINRGRFSLLANSPAEYSALTMDLVGGSTVIDMLGLRRSIIRSCRLGKRYWIAFGPSTING